MAFENSAISSKKSKGRSVVSLSRPSGLVEAGLVTAAKNGQSTAFAALCEQYTQQLFRAAHRITRSHEDAEDAVQDAFLRAFVHLRDFDGRSSFGTWLTRIAINSALMLLRKKRAWRETYVDDFAGPRRGESLFWDRPDSSPNPEYSCLQRERADALRRALGNLRPRIRQVLELRQLQEHSTKQTAGIMGISTAAAKARLFHGRRALRNCRALRTVCNASSARRASTRLVKAA